MPRRATGDRGVPGTVTSPGRTRAGRSDAGDAVSGADPSATPAGDDDEWMRPIGHDRSAPLGWTRLGTLDGPGEPIVDARGVLQVAPGLPGIDWWIAGDDRWYFPSTEKTVRQSLMHNTPVVETRMRVKGGDVCLRSYAVTVPTSVDVAEVVVLEVENTTGVPCGVAFAVRPFGVREDTPIHRVSIDGGVLRADGSPVLILPRDPAGALAAPGVDGDIVARVARGEATGSSFEPVDCPQGRAQAVVVVPLAHRNSFRVVVPVPGIDGVFAPGSDEVPRAVPPAENVAKGWRAHVRDGARVTVADPRLQAVFDAAPSWMLATTNHPGAAIGRSVWDVDTAPRWSHVAAVGQALDRLGLHERSGTLLARAAAAYRDAPSGDAGALVEAFADHVTRTGDVDFVAAVVDASVQITGAARQASVAPVDAWRRHTMYEAAAEVFVAAGERSAASSATKAARGSVGDVPTKVAAAPGDLDRCSELAWGRAALLAGDAVGAWDLLDRYLDAVTSTGVWSEFPAGGTDRHSVGVSAAVVSLAVDLLAAVYDDTVRLIAHLPGQWTGRPLEVTRVPTALGSVGYAVRWHGPRPAVLWELAPGPGVREVPGAPTVTAPGLDASWRATGVSGEALLAPVAEPAEAPKVGSRMTGLQIGRSRGTS